MKGLSKGRYDETFAGEDEHHVDYLNRKGSHSVIMQGNRSP